MVKVEKKELYLLTKKSLIASWWINKRYKYIIYLKMLKYCKVYKNQAAIVNNCLITGQVRFLLRDFRLSRMSVNKVLKEGCLAGIKRASW